MSVNGVLMGEVIFSNIMGKRIFLFLLTNLAIVLTLTIVVSVLGVAGGPDLGSLAVFCLIWGMGGAFISLQMSFDRISSSRLSGNW